MRRAFLLALVLASAAARAQGWRWVSPKPQGVAVNAAAFVGAQGWLVGANGTIATTTDGARTFTPQRSGVSADLFGVFFLDATHGWAVGDLGTLLATSDGGATWLPQTAGTSRKLHGVWFTDAQHGLAVGDFRTLLQTADGGRTWTGRGTTALSLNAVTFTDALHGYVCGSGGAIVETADGGNTFNLVQTPSSAHLLAIAFADLLHGWAVGEGGAVVATSDGGQSWIAQSLGAENLVGLVVTSATAASALGDGGTLYATSDGATWAFAQHLTAGALFTALIAEAPGSGAALDAAAQNGQWLREPAGAPAFADVNDGLPRAAAVTSMAFGSLDAGVLVVDEYLYATADRGQHLAIVGPPDSGVAYGWLGVAMASATEAYAVGITGTAAVSHDQGQTWAMLPTGTLEDLQAVQFLPDSGTGWAVGVLGTLLSTTNGGQSWTKLTTGSTGALTEVAFLDPQHGLVGGQFGTLDATLNGTHFQRANLSLSGNVTGLAYAAPGVALMCGDDGSLAHSTNQGLDFYGLATPAVTKGFGALAFVSRQNGWLAGNAPQGNLWATSDGAQSFGLQFAGGQSLHALSFVDATHGYAAGGGGTLLATDSAGGPACAQDADCADAGFAGIGCVGGACVPCTTDDRCGAGCLPCAAPTAYCYGAYCGACENDLQCLPGYCVLGQCQVSTPSDGGGSSSSTSGTAGGSSSGTSGTTSGAGTGTGGTCAPGTAYCQTSSCGCGHAGGGPLLLLAVAGALLWGRRRPRPLDARVGRTRALKKSKILCGCNKTLLSTGHQVAAGNGFPGLAKR